MAKGFLLGVVCTILFLFVGLFAVAKLGWLPANADGPPSQLERRFASTALDAWMENHTPRMDNPVGLNDENLLAGMKLYGDNCAGCHGDANGTAEFGRAFYPKTPQFTSGRTPHDPDGVLHTMAKRGIRLTGMPAFGGMLSDDEIWKIVLFVKNINQLPPAVKTAWEATKKPGTTQPIEPGGTASPTPSPTGHS